MYHDGQPSASEWALLHRLVERLAQHSTYNVTLASVNIGCDTAEEAESLKAHFVKKCVEKISENETLVQARADAEAVRVSRIKGTL